MSELLAEIQRKAVTIALVVIAAVALLSFFAGRATDAEVVATAKEVRITDSVIVVRAETVTVRQKAVTHFDTIVRVANDTQYVVRDSLVTVPVEVIARDIAKDSLISSLYSKDTTRVWQLASRDKHYTASLRQANAPRWGVGVTLGYGCTPFDCGPTLNVGLSYQARFPNIKGLILKAVK